jgi:hypothetical protein
MNAFARHVHPASRVLLPLLALACRDATPITLRYAPPGGTVARYGLEQQATVRFVAGPLADMDPQSVTMSLTFTQTAGAAVDGGLEVTVRIDSFALVSPMLPPGAGDSAALLIRGTDVVLVVNERSQIVRVAATRAGGETRSPAPDGVAEQVAASLRGIMFPLPEGPVRVGDSWTAQTELPAAQVPGLQRPLLLTQRLTLGSLRIDGADTVAHVEIETVFPREPIQLQQGGATVMARLEGALRGEQDVTLPHGVVQGGALSGSLRMTLQGGMMDGTSVSVEQRTSLRRLDGAAP